MITFSEQGKAELLKAFIAAQSEMDGAKKTANNPAFKSKYADLAAVCDAVMEALTKHKIGVVQSPSYDENGLHVQTMFVHEGGGTMCDILSLRPAKTDPQGIGSAITYARRYALAAMCGIAPEDDDGNAASNIEGGKGRQVKPNSSSQLKKNGVWQVLEAELTEAADEGMVALQIKWEEHWPTVRSWNPSWKQEAEDLKDSLKRKIQERDMDQAARHAAQ